MKTLKEFYDSGEYLKCGSILILQNKSNGEREHVRIGQINKSKIMLFGMYDCNRWDDVQGNYERAYKLTYAEIMKLLPEYTINSYHVFVPTKYTFNYSL